MKTKFVTLMICLIVMVGLVSCRSKNQTLDDLSLGSEDQSEVQVEEKSFKDELSEVEDKAIEAVELINDADKIINGTDSTKSN